MTELPTSLKKRAEDLFKWRMYYKSTAGGIMLGRIYGQNKKQCMELLDKSLGDKGSLLKDLVDYIFDIRKAILNDPHQYDKTKQRAEEYAMQKFDEYLFKANAHLLGVPQ